MMKVQRSDGRMNYKRGFQILKAELANADIHLRSEAETLEHTFWQNEWDEMIFSRSENTRHEHGRIVFALNEFCLRHVGVSFNDCCSGSLPMNESLNAATHQDIVNLIEELKAILLSVNAAERAQSERIWQVVQQGRIEQGELGSVVESLRRWAQSVQTRGLPQDVDQCKAILNLTQPVEGRDGMYNYLHLALPLLPGLLSVESEIDLNKLWNEMRERWGG
jgi:hypothetical protein